MLCLFFRGDFEEKRIHTSQRHYFRRLIRFGIIIHEKFSVIIPEIFDQRFFNKRDRPYTQRGHISDPDRDRQQWTNREECFGNRSAHQSK
jgi:hypothetical protein